MTDIKPLRDLDNLFAPARPVETTLYRNRIYRDQLVEAIQLTADNERDVFEWIPGKQFYEPGGRINGLTVFTPEGRRRAVDGD